VAQTVPNALNDMAPSSLLKILGYSRFLMCCFVLKLQRLGHDWDQRSRPNLALFTPL